MCSSDVCRETTFSIAALTTGVVTPDIVQVWDKSHARVELILLPVVSNCRQPWSFRNRSSRVPRVLTQVTFPIYPTPPLIHCFKGRINVVYFKRFVSETVLADTNSYVDVLVTLSLLKRREQNLQGCSYVASVFSISDFVETATFASLLLHLEGLHLSHVDLHVSVRLRS